LNIALRVTPLDLEHFRWKQIDSGGGLIVLVVKKRRPPDLGSGDTIYLTVNGQIQAAVLVRRASRTQSWKRKFWRRDDFLVEWTFLRNVDASERGPVSSLRTWAYVSLCPSDRNREVGATVLRSHQKQLIREEAELLWP
jgi:hypothetical protein